MGKINRRKNGFRHSPEEDVVSVTPTQASSDHLAKEKLALTQINQRKFKKAEIIYKELISEGTLNYVVFGNLAAIYGMQGRFDELIEVACKSLELNPEQPEAHYNIANALQEKGELKASIIHYNDALRLRPNYLEAYTNLGNAHKESGNLDDAIKSYKKALKIDPNIPDIHINTGNVLKMKNQLNDATTAYNNALELEPNNPEAHWNCALIMLLRGNYLDGLEKYEWRSKIKNNSAKPHALPLCTRLNDNDELKNISQLVLVTEQGLGDTLQFMRYAIALKNLGISVAMCAQPKLHNLIKTCGITPSPLTPEQTNRISEGKWMPLLSTLRYLKVTPDNPIITKPYIKTTDELNEKWANILSAEKQPIIGINWQGNPKIEKTGLHGRSLQLEAFTSIISRIDMTLVALQKGFGSEQLETCTFKNRFVSCQQLVNMTWDFLDTAAIIANCDLVITSDTAVAHLAGGMGKITWLLLHQVPDWRWGLEGDTTFWYPSMRLFRQRERGNWDEVLERVGDALEQHFASNTDSALS